MREILENIRKTSRPSRPESITDQDARLYAEIGAGIIDEFLDVQDADDVWSELLRGPCIREIFLACDGYKDGDDDDDGGDGSKNENKNENKNDCDTLIVIYVCRDTLLLDSFRDFARRADKLLCRKCSKSKYKDALAIWQAALDQYDRTGVMTTEERAACDARARSKEPNMKKPATFERWALRMWRELHDLKRPSDPAEIEKKVDNANMSTAGWTKDISQRVDIIATTTPALAPERAQANTPPPKYEFHPPLCLPVSNSRPVHPGAEHVVKEAEILLSVQIPKGRRNTEHAHGRYPRAHVLLLRQSSRLSSALEHIG